MNREKVEISQTEPCELPEKHTQSNEEQRQATENKHIANFSFGSQSLLSSFYCRSGANNAAFRSRKKAGRRVGAGKVHQNRCFNLLDETSLKGEKCRIARSLATQLLLLLMQNSQDASRVMMNLEIKEQQNHDEKNDVVWSSRCEGRQHSLSLSFAEVVKKGSNSLPHLSFSASLATVSSTGLPCGDVGDRGDCNGGCGDNDEEEGKTCGVHSSQRMFVLVPEKEEYLPQLITSLRAISLPTISLGTTALNKGGVSASVVSSSNLPAAGCRGPVVAVAVDGEGGGKRSVRNSTSTEASLPFSGVEEEWEEIRAHFDTVCRLVRNRAELKVFLDSALSGCWCLDGGQSSNETQSFFGGDVNLLPPSRAMMSEGSSTRASFLVGETDTAEENHEGRELLTDVSVASSTLNYNAAPFESRMHSALVTAPQSNLGSNCVNVSSNTPAFVTPTTSSSCGFVNETEKREKMTKSAATTLRQLPTAASNNAVSPTLSYLSSPAVTFKLESREEMLRRRSAAYHADVGVPANYYGVSSRGSWSGQVSPLSSFINPAASHSFCPFDYLLVLDFEATCEEVTPPSYLHEIIEFPAVLVDVKLQRSVAEFHRYVKPKMRPQLSEFCRCLTGIQQEDIDNAMPLEDVIRHFERWYSRTVPPGSRTILVTDGPTDLREFMYVHSVTRQGIRFPRMFYQWIDVKRVFAHFFQCQQGKIKAMLDVLHCPFEGRLHSGIDDARNIATIVIRMLQLGCSFCEIPLCRLPYGATSLTPNLMTSAAATTISLTQSSGNNEGESPLAS